MIDLAAITPGLVDAARRRGLAPEPQLSVSEWADRNRVLPATNAEPGAWRTSRVPYLREIMDCLSVASPVERVVFMKGAQTGGTEAGMNAIGYWISHAPGLILAVWPSIDMVRRNSRTRIEPLIEGTPAIRERIAPPKSRDSGNTITLKEFPGGALVMTGANSATGLRSTPARYLVLDEVDAFPADADEEGDPVALAIQRTVTFRGRRKILLISTPTIAGVSRIEKAYAESDRRKFFVPCPHCATHQVLEWSGVTWDADSPRAAFYSCRACGGVIEERDKPDMLAKGEWRATATGDGLTAGFHLSALYSPFESWGEIAVDFLACKSDPVRLKSWVNLKLGEAFEDRETAPVEADTLMARAEATDGEDWGELLPDGVALITAGIDTQDDRLEAEIVGWGMGEESWSLDYQVFWGDPAKPDVWRQLDGYLARRFRHPRAVPDLAVAAVAIDTGGHRTGEVMKYVQARQNRRVWAIKGRGGPGVPAWPKRPPKPKRNALAPLFIIGVDGIKHTLLARLRITEPGPGCCHFPAERDRDWFLGLTAERPVRKWKKGVAKIEWVKDSGVRNEPLDCRVYAAAALQGWRTIGQDLVQIALPIKSMQLRSGQPEVSLCNSTPQSYESKWLN
ncbi:phage terminase large subunit family protein [Breoghania sp. L-A4]|uniref:phage terminase large subunit family protein n=1 Tax=Breoghania sp. L-A4 TaxID=2304600 RepID=UPI000E35D117|nr:phage terminase large subunit family protein [Breoghania sp. L-A4]AXS39705.1 phage terminase large subunit family protein [Breoghania sp. L-A4]